MIIYRTYKTELCRTPGHLHVECTLFHSARRHAANMGVSIHTVNDSPRWAIRVPRTHFSVVRWDFKFLTVCYHDGLLLVCMGRKFLNT